MEEGNGRCKGKGINLKYLKKIEENCRGQTNVHSQNESCKFE